MNRNWAALGGAVIWLAGAAAYATPAQAQQKPEPQPKTQAAAKAGTPTPSTSKASTQAQQKGSAVAKVDPKATPKKTAGKPKGRLEKLTCMRGTEDEHARIAVEVIGGQVQSFAYYSKKKPRTCSVHVQRDDAYSRWSDEGRFVKVTTDNGDFLIENRPRDVKFLFRDVDRMHYCGMDFGKINGTLTVLRGKRECVVERLMDAHQEDGTAVEAVPGEKAEQKQPPRS